MEAFLIEHLWLPDEDGHLRLSVIEDYTYEQTIQQFGPPSLKTFTEADGVKVQDLRWAIDARSHCPLSTNSSIGLGDLSDGSACKSLIPMLPWGESQMECYVIVVPALAV